MPTNDIGWRDYVDARLASVDKTEQQLQHSITETEKRIRESMIEKEISNAKMYTLLEERVSRLTQFRDTISSERGLYVTRDQLKVLSDAIDVDLDLLKRGIQISTGREVGITKTWGAILIAFNIMIGITALVSWVGQFVKLAH